jgi:DNA-binding NarL/FixJ family response regulator
MTAMELLKSVRKQHPNTTFIVCVEPENLRGALLAMMGGASGFLTSQQPSGAVARQLRTAQIRQNLVSALAKTTSHETTIRIAAPLAITPVSIHRKGVRPAQRIRTAVAN